MGKLAATDWQAKWIRADDDISSPSFRKQFKIGRSIARATATICGLGYYELFLNGGKVGDQVLDPGTTYYNHDQEQYDLRARALYATHDVTDYLRTGQNAVGVMLGNGCYSAEDDVDPSPGHRTPYSDRPRMILQLDIEYSDGQKLRIVTDESFKNVEWSDHVQRLFARRDLRRTIGTIGLGQCRLQGQQLVRCSAR